MLERRKIWRKVYCLFPLFFEMFIILEMKYPSNLWCFKLLLFHKLIAALKKRKNCWLFVLQKLCKFCCNNYGDDAFFFESKTLQVFWHQRFFNTKTKRNKQREKQELCPKPKHSKTAKTMLWIKELLVQLLSSTLAYINEQLKINLWEI